MKKVIALLFILSIRGEGQVIDVNGDKIVGAEEAIAVAEQWKGPAGAQNDHNHLGRTWTGNRNPLTIRGNFPPRLIIGPLKKGTKGATSIASAPLILDNTATSNDGFHYPDLILRGVIGMISAQEHSGSELHLVSNGNVVVQIDSDNNSAIPTFSVRNGERTGVAAIFDDGDMGISGTLTTAGGTLKIDHPQDPANKFLAHSYVESPEMKNVYDGVVVLDEGGEAWVDLPDYFEAFNSDFRYQLTGIGGFAPVYVAEEIDSNRFKIAGGQSGMKVSWMVTGVRQDAYAKGNPVEVEQEKSGEEKGRYLHPERFGKPVTKSVSIVSQE